MFNFNIRFVPMLVLMGYVEDVRCKLDTHRSSRRNLGHPSYE